MPRALLAAYAGALILCLALFGWRMGQPSPIFKTDIQALTKSAEAANGGIMTAAVAAYEAQNTEVLLTLLGPLANHGTAEAQAELARELGAAGLENLTANAAASALQTQSFLHQYRFQLLSLATQDALQNKSDAYWLARAQRNLLQPGGAGLKDPFGLSAMPVSGNAVPENGYLRIDNEEGRYMLAVWRLPASPFDIALQNRVSAVFAEYRASLSRPSELLTAGVLAHATAASQSAQSEVRWLGGLSLVGILLLAYWAFAGFMPLISIIMVASASMLVGFVAVIALLGEIHLLALLLASSVIGMSVDYVLHYLCARMGASNIQPQSSARQVSRGVLMAAVTSLSGYLVLLGSAPLLSQLAIFTAAGLSTAAVITLFLLPRWSPLQQVKSAPRALSVLAVMRLPRFWLLCLPLAIAGLYGVTSSNNPASFYFQNPSLMAQQEKLQAITGQDQATQVFVVSAETADAVLVTEKLLVETLQKLQPPVMVRAASRFLPPLAAQQQSLEIAESRLLDKGLLASVANTFGLSESWLQDQQKALAIPLRHYSAEALEALPEGSSSLWLNSRCDGCAGFASMVTASGLSPEQLKDLPPLKGVSLVEPLKVAEAGLDGLHNELLLRALGVWLVMLLILMLRYRAAAIRILLAPTAAALAVCGVLGWFGLPLNIFHLAGVMVTVGLGLDYQLFRKEAGASADKQQHVAMAVWLSAFTTALAFGLLLFSQTPAVSAFGGAVVLGLLFNLLLAFIGQQRQSAG